MRCAEPVKVLEILRLTEDGYSQREIAQSVKCGKSTVGEIQKRCRNCKLRYDVAEKMTNDEIKLLLYPDSYDVYIYLVHIFNKMPESDFKTDPLLLEDFLP
ncbi:hypothetical protein UF75_4521 [Desulfosporosinus sp. I2]|uniref:helix-turn-helix domain-containing protein n=1 Tax=Desulfosporosinus sp. I2 TaxID=1617025 RepID=UPI0005EDEECE|nr:helix-turn-helix domain-containing protein [Desulfosporosinus sp. I2]KJR45106.1 hypothetical protein UF75_4521 [Desulfosporosinus sp. I2]